MTRERLLKRIDDDWTVFNESYAGLSDSQLTEPGAMGDWSVKDVIAHVTTWEEEALKNLPLILTGGRPPRYVRYGGIDAFNARMTEQKRALSLAQVLQEHRETHGRLVDFIRTVPEEQCAGETRVLRRLRLDTYRHYGEHARAIREWRDRSPSD